MFCLFLENLPLIGTCPNAPDGYYVAGCMSGYGIMGSMSAGDLISKVVSGQELPDYAKVMSPHRYNNGDLKAYLDENAHLGSGQIWYTKWKLVGQ